MRKPWSVYKPAAPARMHLLLAALMWTSVGSALLFFGIRWMRAADISHVALMIGAGGVLGVLKSRLVLYRTARKTISRIHERGDGRCLGGFLSWRSWLLVLLMAVCGRLFRGSGLPVNIISFVYVAVGVALLVTSLTLWHGWHQQVMVDAERE